MRTIRWVGVALIFFTMQVCEKRAEDTGGDVPALPQFKMEHFSWEIEDCKEAENYCARISVTYPVLESNVNRAVKQRVNEAVLQAVSGSLGILGPEMHQSASLEGMSRQFFKTYAEYTVESEFPTIWELETTSEVLFVSSRAISISMENYGYTGGAHPNSNMVLLNFDLSTGKPLELSALISDMQAMKRLAERAFRESRDLSPDADLNEAGFFGDNGFQLPANFGITPEGLYFYYNSYEIAAYAAGPTDFVLAWKDLGDLVRKSLIE